MIVDNEKRFPDSVVVYTRFRNYELQQMFAYLREREEVLKIELSREAYKPCIRERLEEVEKLLIWMAHNVTGSGDEKARRLKGKNLVPKNLSLWGDD